MIVDLDHLLTVLGGVVGGGGIVTWRKAKIDAGKLALEIARSAEKKAQNADKKAQNAVDRVEDFQRLAMAHLPWDMDAMKQINKLGGSIGEPPPLYPTE